MGQEGSPMTAMKTLFAALAAVACLAVADGASSVSGAGATFPYPVYAKWAVAYKKATGIAINYQSIGSGGISQIKARTVTFSATDKPLDQNVLDDLGVVQFPTVIGGVVPVVNVPGVAPGRLVLNGPLLAEIYLGRIVNWNDSAIARLNPGIKLPNRAIAVVYRAEGSGTTYVFTSYLARFSPVWRKNVGVDLSVGWPAGVGIGAKGNEGVANIVLRTAGAIGYVEYAYAKQNKLAYVCLAGHDGGVVMPSADSFGRAAVGVDWAAAGGQGFRIDLLDRPGAGVWPITSATYILVLRHPQDTAGTADVLKFFQWAYANGGPMALSLDYVPLPDAAVKAVMKSWQQIQGVKM
jgi:phosphate transport system substrate-binding protein